jgi:hypothetical protein
LKFIKFDRPNKITRRNQKEKIKRKGGVGGDGIPKSKGIKSKEKQPLMSWQGHSD